MKDFLRPLGLMMTLALSFSKYDGYCQNLILNPRFDATATIPFPGFVATGPNDDGSPNSLYEYWDYMPFWQPPKFNGLLGFGHLGSADIVQNNYHSAGSCVNIGGLEFIVGEITAAMNPLHMYYFQAYISSSDIADETFRVSLSYDRPRQYNSKKDIKFISGHSSFSPSRINYNEPPEWYRVSSQILALGAYDRIIIGSIGEGGSTENVSVVAHRVDDIKLIDLGPGGYCPNIRYIQNITYEDEIIVYKAAEKIIAGNDVGATYTSPGSVTVGGTSNITYRAGEEIQLLDGFGVEAGATFHAYIHPCECDPPTAIAGSNAIICDGAPFQLGHEGLSYLEYSWSSDPYFGTDYLSDVNSSQPIFAAPANNNNTTITYTLTVSNSCGDQVSDDVLITYVNAPDDTPELSVNFLMSELPVQIWMWPDELTEVIVIEAYDYGGTGAPHHTWELDVFQDFTPSLDFVWQAPPGTLPVCDGFTLKVKSKNMCSDVWSTYHIATAEPSAAGSIIDMNNVFTIDVDPPGDAIYLFHSGFISYSLSVWNGVNAAQTLIYSESNIPINSNPMLIWDEDMHNQGVFGGTSVPNGTYFFDLTIYDCLGNNVNFPSGEGFWSVFPHPSERYIDPQAELDDHGLRDRESEVVAETGHLVNSVGIQIVPNPNSGNFLIVARSIQSIQVLEASGKLVQQLKGPVGTTVEISGLTSGLYIVRAQMADGSVENAKVVVQ